MDATTQQALFQAALFAQMAMMSMAVVAQQGRPYQATEQSAAKARQSRAAHIPSRRTKKLSAADKAKVEASKWGY